MLQFDCINHDKSKIDLLLEGQIIRTSYLLADIVRVSGTTYMGLDAEKQFAKADAQLKKQMILSYARRVPDPMYIKEIERIYETLNNGRKNVKHENKQMIVARKRIEKLLDQIFESSRQEMMNSFALCGYTGLMPLVDEDAILLWGAHSEEPESAEDNGVPYSVILSSKWKDEEDEVYCFIDLFWEYMREHNLLLSPFDEADDNAAAITFRIPDMVVLNSLSATELKAIKQEVFGDMQPMRKAIEEWSLQLRAENFSAGSFSSYSHYFTSSILPYVQTIEERITASHLLGKINDFGKGKVGVQNYLAVSSAKTAWGFMEWSGMVPKQSMHAFEENLPAGCDGDKAVLLFISKSFNHLTEEETAGGKKSLQL